MKRCGFLLMGLLIPAAAGADIFEAASDGDLNQIDAEKDQVHEVDPRSGLTAWQIAKIRGREEAADLLMHHGADPKLEFPAPNKTLDKLLTHFEKDDAPGVAVMVAKDGEIVFEDGYGLANLETGDEITKDTVFRIGSISKQFAAVATLLLADDEKLSVDDKLNKFYPDWPRGDEITLHHLLTHTSGMTSFTDLPSFEPYEATTPEEVIAAFRDKDHMFDPGKDWHYCNSGYFLLGEIASQVGGKPYPQLLKERVFDPNKMTRIGAHRPELELENEALGYIRVDEDWGLPEKDWHMSHAGGAGEFYATLGDLFRWNEAIFTSDVLKPETRKAAHTPNGIESDSPLASMGMAYGYGWIIEEYRGLQIVWHNGGFPGFYCRLTRFPEYNLTVAALSNSSQPPAGMEPDAIAEMAASLWLWQEMDAQPSFRSDETKMNEEELAAYVGTFDFLTLGVMRFRVEDGKLQGRLATQPWSDLVSTGDDEWQIPSVKAKFTFERDDDGNVKSVQLDQGGLKLSGAKFEEPKVAETSREQLEEFAGTYKLQLGADFIIRIDDQNRMMAKLGPQQEFRYYPMDDAEDRVFCKSIKVELQFERDDDGKVNAMVLHQGGAKIRGKRKE